MSKLKFFGSGGAFSTKKSNSSAYLESYNEEYKLKTLIIIDCGETVVRDIMEHLNHNDYNDVVVFITHMHSDHVGGLPTLAYYLHYIKNIKPTIYAGSMDIINDIMTYLNVTKALSYCEIGEGHDREHDIDNIMLIPIRTNHVCDMASYGLYISFRDKIKYAVDGDCEGNEIDAYYYSGDSSDAPYELLREREFQTTCVDKAIVTISLAQVSHWYQDIYLGKPYDGCPHAYPETIYRDIQKTGFKGQLHLYHNDETDPEDVYEISMNNGEAILANMTKLGLV